ncbi:procollagen galactosyltransferase 1-A-like isoform X1 [Branchiostoma floridae x Branchiostoma belcheri]
MAAISGIVHVSLLRFAFILLLTPLFWTLSGSFEQLESLDPERMQWPTIFVAILARNKAHSLPYTLGYLERQDYPKSRMALWIQSDHNIDNTSAVIQEWLDAVGHLYHHVDYYHQDSPNYFPDEEGANHWSETRLRHVIKLRQQALEYARKRWADFMLFLDADNLVTNPRAMKLLIAQNRPIIAPMLESSTAYSNFWCGMTEKGYYMRTEEYMPTVERKRKGVFPVPMVHSTYLVDLRREGAKQLNYDSPAEDYFGPEDDIIQFAWSARTSGMEMFIMNTEEFGFLPSALDENMIHDEETLKFKQILLDEMSHDTPEGYVFDPLVPSAHISPPNKTVTKMGFDEIYVINLKRRPERRKRMVHTLKEIGLDFKLMEAVDGLTLNASVLKKMGVTVLPEYKDPWADRSMTMGEIGCFLSHYKIWEEMVEKNLDWVLVFEDDIRFEPFFKRRMYKMLNEIEEIRLDWDLIYIGRKKVVPEQRPGLGYVGRKRMQLEGEHWVLGTTTMIHVTYSYWTLGYMITWRGAKKLLDVKPLTKMIPVDEFLPMMFDDHPDTKYMYAFEPRDLKAFSAEPLMIYPTHYTGEANYITDTDTGSSPIVPDLDKADSGDKPTVPAMGPSEGLPTPDGEPSSHGGEL